MAMDYLPIQATAVPCERVFSSSAETDTKRRNRISSPLMEALQMQKFRFKKERLDFMRGWKTEEKQLVEDAPDEDLLRTLIQQDTQSSQNNFDKVIRSIIQHEDD
jgi:hAT family C-terminal dimerisation region